MQEILEQIVTACRPYCSTGKVASYIPELSKADPFALGLALAGMDGKVYSAGDSDHPFTMQSIAKVVSLCLALMELGPELVFSKIGLESVADPFNSIFCLEKEGAFKPHNPFINSGSIVLASLLPFPDGDSKFEAILEMARSMTGNSTLNLNYDVFYSEKFTSDRNRSLAYFLKSTDSIEGDVEETLDIYFKQCSIEATAIDLAVMGATLAGNGRNPVTGEEVFPPEIAKIVRALMVTCGTYDGSGEFAVKVGLPAKSGVGGGIMATLPRRMGVAAYGPALDFRGNSAAGTKALEMLSEEADLRLF
ncbi:MAG: glutaminase A [Synergistales bacterium]|nr:glutaminase A [Synergistales bacterium]